eukprot:Sspe_Gene.41658::Locus_20159_Transcript_1_1_Confidence_1.000_Length_4828::g.41658::m.41658
MARLGVAVVVVAGVLARGWEWAPVPRTSWPRQGGGSDPGSAPLTQWAATVAVDTPRSEYPRPQMVREGLWGVLNGIWEFDINNTADLSHPPVGGVFRNSSGAPYTPGGILVPFPPQAALSGVGHLPPHGFGWYRTVAILPPADRILLHVERCDWNCTVYVNGQNKGWHAGGYDTWTTEIPSDGSPTEIIIGFDDRELSQVEGKQDCSKFANPYGITYTCTSGVWDTVWWEAVPALYIHDVVLLPSFAHNILQLDIAMCNIPLPPVGHFGSIPCNTSSARTDVHIFWETSQEGNASFTSSGVVRFSEPRRGWSPDSPALYRVIVSAGLDKVTMYTGFRDLSLGGDPARRLVNGQALFTHGVLSQGFFPDGIYTAPSDAAMQHDLLLAKSLGFNAVRVHQKVEPRRFYAHADRIGLAVLQDMPHTKMITGASEEWFTSELTAMVRGLRNAVSVIQYQIFNEGGGGAGSCPLVCHNSEAARKADTQSRLIVDISGGGSLFPGAAACCDGGGPSNWTGHCCGCGCGMAWDAHHYPNPIFPLATAGMGSMANEYGGLKGNIPFHGGFTHEWYNGRCGDAAIEPASFVSNFTNWTRAIASAITSRGLSSAVYTQISDVECECNGLQTYDRYVKLAPQWEALIREANLWLLGK